LAATATSSNPPVTHTPTPPYGYASAKWAGKLGAGAYGAYGQQGYGGYQQQQQQQQQPQYQQYQRGGGYAGYPEYAAQPAVQAVATKAGVGVGSALPDALAGIPEEQKVRSFFRVVYFFVCVDLLLRFSLFLVPNLHYFFVSSHFFCSVSWNPAIKNVFLTLSRSPSFFSRLSSCVSCQ